MAWVDILYLRAWTLRVKYHHFKTIRRTALERYIERSLPSASTRNATGSFGAEPFEPHPCQESPQDASSFSS